MKTPDRGSPAQWVLRALVGGCVEVAIQLGSPDLNRDLTAPKAGGLPLHHSPEYQRQLQKEAN